MEHKEIVMYVYVIPTIVAVLATTVGYFLNRLRNIPIEVCMTDEDFLFTIFLSVTPFFNYFILLMALVYICVLTKHYVSKRHQYFPTVEDKYEEYMKNCEEDGL
jgi:formate hydrogenlyase subunit 3/multisubunit Na+/H+ antiporter MnhD subunit